MDTSRIDKCIDYIISCMDKDCNVKIKDHFAFSICASVIENENAVEYAKIAFAIHKDKQRKVQ